MLKGRKCNFILGSRPKGLRGAVLALGLVLLSSGCAQLNNRPPASAENMSREAQDFEMTPALEAALAQTRLKLAAQRPEQAIVELMSAQRDYPNAPQIALLSGQIYEQLGQEAQAREVYEAYILNGGRAVAVQTALGLLHLRSGRNTLADSILLSVVAKDRQQSWRQSPPGGEEGKALSSAYNGLGVIADRNENYELAAEYYLGSLRIEPRPETYNNLGYSRFLNGNYGGADWAYRKALDLVPDYRPAILNLALLRSTQGRDVRARELLQSINAEPGIFMAVGLEVPAFIEPPEQGAIDTPFSHAVTIPSPDRKTSDMMNPDQERSATQATDTATAVVLARLLRIRNENSYDGEVIGWLKAGTEVNIVEESGDWLYVEYNAGSSDVKLHGWVFGRYIGEAKS